MFSTDHIDNHTYNLQKYTAFNYNIPLSAADFALTMDSVVGDTLIGTTYKDTPFHGTLMNGTNTGYHDNSLYLDGIDDCVDLGYHGDSCFGNITQCINGLTVAMWLWLRVTGNDQWYFSSSKGPIVNLHLKQSNFGILKVKLKTLTHNYEASSYELSERWTHIAATWYLEETSGHLH